MSSAVPSSMVCPVFGALARPLVYGMPGPDLAETARRGEVVLGGCVIGDDMDLGSCSGPVEHRWGDDESAARTLEPFRGD
jgi:hypothetical protein